MTYSPAIIKIGISKILDGEIGVLALTSLKKGIVIAPENEFDETLYPWAFFESLDDTTKDRVMGYCLGSPEGFYAPRNINYISIPWHMNHCCEGNVGFNDRGDFVAIRDIEEDEELCWDYGLAETNPSFRLQCLCGKETCRKVITGNDWKDLNFREKNKEHLWPQLREVPL